MKIEWKSCFRVGFSIFLLYLCIYYWPKASGILTLLLSTAAPVLIGGVIAYIINILMSFYEKHYFPKSKSSVISKSRRPICMVLSIASLIAVVSLIIYLVVPQLSSCVQLIFAELPGALKNLVAWLDELNILPENIVDTLAAVDWKSRIGQIINVLVSGIGSVTDIVVSTVSSLVSSVVTGFLSIIFAIYTLLGKDKLGQQFDSLMNRYMKKSWCDKFKHILSVMNDCFHRYVVGQCTEAVILGLLCMFGMMILRLPYATMTGALIGFTALIPVAGAYIGAGIGAFMIFTVSPVKALIFLIFIVVLQQLEGNLIYPRVVGSSMGLPGIWVLTAVTIGGGLMGIGGMLLGVPIAATAYRLLREDVYKNVAVATEVKGE